MSEFKTVWKFQLRQTRDQVVKVPEGAVPVLVADQRGGLMVWVECDPGREMRATNFVVVGTGHPVPDLATHSHIGSVTMSRTGLVWHVYMDGSR